MKHFPQQELDARWFTIAGLFCFEHKPLFIQDKRGSGTSNINSFAGEMGDEMATLPVPDGRDCSASSSTSGARRLNLPCPPAHPSASQF